MVVQQQALLHAGQDLIAHIQLGNGVGAVVQLVVPVVVAHGDLLALDADGQVGVHVKAVFHHVGGIGPADHHAVGIQVSAAPGAVDHVVLAVLHGGVVVLILHQHELDPALQGGAHRSGAHGVLHEVHHLLVGGVGAIDMVLDLHHVRLGDVAVGQALVVGGLEQGGGSFLVIAGQAVQILHAVNLPQGVLGVDGGAVGLAGERVADVHVVQQAEGGLGAGGAAADVIAPVEGVGHGLAEVLVGQDGLVDAGHLTALEHVEVRVQRQVVGVAGGGVVHIVAGAVGGHVVLGQAHSVQVALQEHGHLRGVLVDLLQVDAGGLVLTLVAAVAVAEPGVVAVKDNFLGLLVADDLVRAVGTELVHRRAVGGLDDAAGLGLVGLVEGLVDQDQVVDVHLEVKQGAGVLQNDREGVLVVLHKAHLLPGGCFHDAVLAVGVVDQVVPGFAPALGHGEDQVDGLVGHGDVAVLIGHGVQSVVVVGGHVSAVLLQGVAGQIIQGRGPAEVGLVALSIDVLAVLARGEFRHGPADVGSLAQLHAACLVAVVVVLRIGQGDAAGIEQGGAVVLHAGVEELLQGVFRIMGGDGGAVLPGGVLAHLHLPGIALGGVRRYAVGLVARVGGGHVHGELLRQLAHNVVAVPGLVHPEAVEHGHGIAQHVILRGDGPVGGRPGGHAGVGAAVGVGGVALGQRRCGQGEQHGKRQQHGHQFLHSVSSLS